jgi:Putative zinc-finger
MRHLSVENLMTYVDGQAVAADKQAFEQHLHDCAECSELRQDLQNLVNRLREDSIYEPPSSVLQWGMDLFQPVMQPSSSGGRIRKIIASLVFDTFEQPALAGLRRVGAPPRQLLFRAGDVDVDVKIESMEANDRITLVGQVLSTGAKFFDNTPVKLESHGIVRYKTRTNLVGEFSFDEVPKDTYHLSVDLPEGQITLFCVHRANA